MFRRTTLAFAAAAALAGASLAGYAQTPADAPKPIDTVTITGDRDSPRPADRNELAPNPADVAATQMSRDEVKQELYEAERFGIMEDGDIGATDQILANRIAYNEHIEALYLSEQAAQQAQPADTGMPATEEMPTHPALQGNAEHPAPDAMSTEQMPDHPALQGTN